jgi:hypothetical protein
MTITHAEVADRTGTTIPAHLEAQAAVPTITNGWRQGDVYIRRETHTPTGAGIPLAGTGHKVIAGEADRNSHILNGDGHFHPGQYNRADRLRLDYGVLVVPTGGLAVLTHTGEHGSVAIPEGTWRVWGQLDAATQRRAAD